MMISRYPANSSIDRRFWGLDSAQSAELIRLYEDGKTLAARRLNIQEHLEEHKKSLFGEDWPEITHAMIHEARLRDSASEGRYEAELLKEHAEDQRLLMDEDEKTMEIERRLRVIDSQLDSIAEACSDLELRPSFTSPILARLPRELRDYIYDFLWSDEDIERLDAAISFIPYVVTVHDQPAVDLLDLPVPRYANSSFVGNEFASEVAMRYFRALTGAAIDYRCVRAHLNRSYFGPMHLTMKDVIKNVVMTISRVAYCSYGTKVFAADALADSLESLFILKDHRNLPIEIYLDHTLQYKPALFEILEIIRPMFLQFRDAKMNVKVLGYDFFNPIDDRSQDVFSEQLNYYFDLSPEEWLDMKAEEIKAIPDKKQRMACKGILRAMRTNLAFVNANTRNNEENRAG
ncbi:hypothetical protein ACJBU6_04486 [Exserohilum turcicum]